jgi:hypothetical protein
LVLDFMISRILNFNWNPNSQRLVKHVYSFLDQNSPIFLDLLPSLIKIFQQGNELKVLHCSLELAVS